MSNRPCGEPLMAPCPALFFTTLTNDDAGGRDVLYPVPEPGGELLAAAALAALGVARRARRGSRYCDASAAAFLPA